MTRPRGHADQAIAFYQSTLGAEPRALQRFGDSNPSGPEALKKNVMHCELRFGEAVMMLSDGPETVGAVAGVSVARLRPGWW